MERLKRPSEVSNLLNPAFCGLLLWVAMKKYVDTLEQPMPISYIYLILPLVLHRDTRERLPHSSATSLLAWIKSYPQLEIGFASRARSMTRFTNEAFHFIFRYGYIELHKEAGCLGPSRKFSGTALRVYAEIDDEIDECIKKARVVGSILARCSSPSSAYTALGVMP